MRLATEYAVTARVLAQRWDDPRARHAGITRMRCLPRLEDTEAGFLKARCAMCLKALVLNTGDVPGAMHADLRELLLHMANFLMMLPDARQSRAGRREERASLRGGYVRPVPERD
jgi:hypothetical protein